jgi:hypothetical protein
MEKKMGNSLSGFGIECRHIRTNRGVKMIDQAKQFGCSPSFISAVETGDKPVPDGYVEKFCEWMRIDTATKKQLEILAEARTNVIRFTPVNREKAVIARRLFRKINKMTPDEIRKLEASLPGDDQ